MKFNLQASNFQNFPGGGMPPDPLKKHASHAEGALHTCHELSANALQKLLNRSTFSKKEPTHFKVCVRA